MNNREKVTAEAAMAMDILGSFHDPRPDDLARIVWAASGLLLLEVAGYIWSPFLPGRFIGLPKQTAEEARRHLDLM